MSNLIEKIVNESLVDALPFHVALLDKNYNIAWANQKFKDFYGDWSEFSSCYQICKKASAPCAFCKVLEVIKTGEQTIAYENITDTLGRSYNYAIYFIPIKDDNGSTEYVLEISSEIKDSHKSKEYNMLFDRVPCHIAIIDRSYNIIRANDKFRETFGDSRNKFCFEAYKKKKTPCGSCPAVNAFSDGDTHTSTQIGTTYSGEKTNYMVTAAPIAWDAEGVSLVMEISTDITEITKLQEQLKGAHDFYSDILQNSAEGIIALDNKGRIQIINNAARRILNWRGLKKPSINVINEILPKEFFQSADETGQIMKSRETTIQNIDGAKVPVRFSAIELRDKKRSMGRVAFISDLRQIKELEHEREVYEEGTRDAIFSSLDKALDILQGVLENEFNRLSDKILNGDIDNIQESLELMKFKFAQTKKVKDAFITFSKRHKTIKEKCDLNGVLATIYEEFSNAAILHRLDFSIEPSDASVELQCNPMGLKACLDIMILNSLNALSKVDNDGYLKIKAYNDYNVATVEVQHNACRKGIAPPASVIKEDCFGISTAESILKENHGVIDIISRNGVCTFKIKLPK